MVMALSGQDLADSGNRSALRALKDTIDALLKRHPETSEARQEESVHLNTAASFAFSSPVRPARSTLGVEELEEESFDATTPAPENRMWRSKRKSSQEKEEKRARLEKREEILRNLRNAVSEFKAEKGDELSGSASSAAAKSQFNPLDKFEMRRQRASFWPQGSKEWARQLLGVELGMDANEKRQCYLDMVKACHPDHNQNIAPDAIQLVNAAWEVLR
jgi:hypothetical protein